MFTFRESRRLPPVRISPIEFDAPADDHRLLDVGRGGFAVQSPTRFALGEEHRFEFLLSRCCSITLHARAMRVVDARGRTRYITGFALMTFGDDDAIADLLVAVVEAENDETLDATFGDLDNQLSVFEPDVECAFESAGVPPHTTIH